MESYNTPLWDLSQATNFAQLPDDDFLAMLQKQFPSNAMNSMTGSFGAANGINPQNIVNFPPGITPPSEDSSPSPDAAKDDSDDGFNGAALKRKASVDNDDQEEGPSHKSLHTASTSANAKKASSSTAARRKSTGTSGPDESRLMKRKEQNRAAQRAFRERKEKHVKDLEDKVAALEAKNEKTASENENLRELLQQLQSENLSLKRQQDQARQQQQSPNGMQQSPFTFAVPKPANGPSGSSVGPFTSDATMFSSMPRFPYSSPPTLTSPSMTNPLDFSSLTSFDPSVLSMLEDGPPQQTATNSSSQIDLGFGAGEGFFNDNFTIIANNPQFLSLASAFDSSPVGPSATPSTSNSHQNSTTPTNNSSSANSNAGSSSASSPFSFDMNTLTSWPTTSGTNGSGNADQSSLDELFGSFMAGTPMDTSFLPGGGNTPSSISPVVHHDKLNMANFSTTFSNNGSTMGKSPSNTSSSSSSSPASDPSLFSSRDASSSSESDLDHMSVEQQHRHQYHSGHHGHHNGDECPKNREEFLKHVDQEGSSPFAPPQPSSALSPRTAVLSSSLARKHGGLDGPACVACKPSTSSFPPVEQSEKNVEVLNAWRIVTGDPHSKDIDINQLCSEFSSKAKCDGTKVVIEPQGLDSILKSLQQHHEVPKTATGH